MAYITREDGEHFVIPSYRDVLSTKQKSVLKKDILALSQSYGEYITLQKKGSAQYEVAFSSDTGYLLGESIWQYFKRPIDMIYCEAIPNTTEAILVIVKAGSVYLDGSFPLDSIPEELIIFLTQQNNFEVYVYGDVPITQQPEAGKFSFEANAIKSFTVLDKPVFANLPLVKMYQLQLVDTVLKIHGIGVFPTKQLIMGILIVGLLWMFYSYLTSHHEMIQQAPPPPNPYQAYYTQLTSPAPSEEVSQFTDRIQVLFAMPGWVVNHLSYAKGKITATVKSTGGTSEVLFEWAKKNNFNVTIQSDGVYLDTELKLTNRPMPKKIYPIKQVLGIFVDRIATVYPGNHFKLDEFLNKTVYTDVPITINVEDVLPGRLMMIGEQLKDLPMVLQSIAMDVNNGSFTGTINIDALGS